MPSAAFTTLGCKVNQYETQRILDSFADAGFSIVPFDQSADVYVINTCSVTSQAEAKSRYTVRKANRTNPDAKVVVTGCAVQMGINKGEPMEGADVLVPNPEKLETLKYFFRENPSFERWAHAEPSQVRPEPKEGRTRATLKIQDGCSVMCSYCSIPYTRPGMVSRPWQEVLAEAQLLREKGYHEAVLTGVLIGAYGPETGSGGKSFEEMVTILSEQSGLERIRISSIEMHQVTQPIIDLAKEGRVVPHFHIPLQSGDTGVLKDMNRRYTQADYLALCADLYQQLPDLTLTTDIMVGFPTESEERFLSSVKVCEEVRYLKGHIFRFSPRFGTPADQWGDPVTPQEKQDRSKRLTEITERTGREQSARFIGRTMRVLVERKRKDGLLEGTSDNWLTVRFAGPIEYLKSLRWIRLDEERDGVLYGEPVSRPTNSLRVV
ncbi:tRNA (N(6)-L-threonylcarbamoyladenosine(37)-C(2))-methylthiotransferase MtaB [Kamptonema cortianum]|nr:tRNA (N(6)-L-threonylcarbamoyladenosine(37)-C(2))-methylthiotransferase MtaB [Geitlerinema splendidum]MDK3158564.1 tRNA (N(6)-L-threonylcarbamoyladenosine(37)-C(2))-methylthiotransferase MtaB [Kamptonema cortianum]